MSAELIELVRIIAMTATFLLVVAVWIGAVIVWASRTASRTQAMRRRLDLEDPVEGKRTIRLWRQDSEVTTTVPVFRRPRSFLVRLEILFHRAGWTLTATQIITLFAGAFALTFVFFWMITGNPLLGAGVVVAIFIIARIYLLARINKREKLFELQFVDALDLASRSLRAGHPLLGAFQLISDEMASPVREVFADICQRQGMGGDLEGILKEIARTSSSEDVKLFATSVAIQIRSGGNLAHLLVRLAKIVRERMRISRRIKVITAQTQMSKRVLLGLPVIIFVLFNLINPSYMSAFYTTPVGRLLIAIAVVMLALGAWVMNKMVNMQY